MPFRKTLYVVGEMEQCSDCCSDVDCDARRSWVETRSVAIEGEPLGHCRFGWQGRTGANGTCARWVQGACGCLAPSFGRERGTSVQADLEEWSATRCRGDSQRSLV